MITVHVVDKILKMFRIQYEILDSGISTSAPSSHNNDYKKWQKDNEEDGGEHNGHNGARREAGYYGA